MYASYFALGQNYLLNNELDKAESMFKKAIPGSDTMAKSYYQIAKIGMLRNNQTKAISNLESAIEVDSSYRQKAIDTVLGAFSKYKSFCFMSATPIQSDFKPDSMKRICGNCDNIAPI